MTQEIDLLPEPSVTNAAFEVVERKGLGHPDTICGALVEEIGLRLSHDLHDDRLALDRWPLRMPPDTAPPTTVRTP